MSKSLGNFITMHELLTAGRAMRGRAKRIRFNMLRTHYRQPLDWTFDGLRKQAHRMDGLDEMRYSRSGMGPVQAWISMFRAAVC